MSSNFWKRSEPITKESVGSPVNYRARGKYVDGIIDAVGDDHRFVRVRLPNGRSKAFRRFYRDGETVWLTGSYGRSRTRLYAGTSAEWQVELAALLAEREIKT